ncbi:MAG: phosphoribosylamine--glycine ligase [Pseudomonadales bacterium]|nr:phosphoribosylamine--glycine ligase [Pseudomonadales bacterium]
MKVMIVGSGGREHALGWKVARNPMVEKVFVAPGNAGTATEAKLENIDIDVMNFAALADFAEKSSVSLTIIGPEAPLVEGIVDYFQSRGLKCFGPKKGAAQLEGSKSFTKDFLARHQIPTAEYSTFVEIEPAIAYIRQRGAPIVVKADGLAAGKGVILASSVEQAEAAVRDMLADNVFGEAGSRVVIEEFLTGEEASYIVMVDGTHILPFATSQDHKARDDGDKGPNTGGMGAYSPAPVVTPEIDDWVMRHVIRPTVDGMAQEGNEYTGFLYAGLMIAEDGTAKVLEYNCRFGDPETQPIMMRMQSDLVALCLSALDKKLDKAVIEWDPRPSIGVVMAAGGYPDTYKKGDKIEGLAEAEIDGAKVFHAGTRLSDGSVVTNGGRVICVTALGNSVTDAQKNAYKAVEKIRWRGAFYRTDIGYRAIQRES